MKYLILGVVIVVIIIIIGIIVFGVNSNKNSNNKEHDLPPDIKKNKGLIELAATGDKCFCSKSYGKNTVDLGFKFCVKERYPAEYYVRNVNLDEHSWKGHTTSLHPENNKNVKSYIEYDADDCKYILTLVDKNGNTIIFDNPSRCITVTVKLRKVCDRDSSSGSSSRGSSRTSSSGRSSSGRSSKSCACSSECECGKSSSKDSRRSSRGKRSERGESESDCTSDKSSKSSRRSSRGKRSERGESDCTSDKSSDYKSDHESSNDSVDPYSNASHCESNKSVSFFPDSSSCDSSKK